MHFKVTTSNWQLVSSLLSYMYTQHKHAHTHTHTHTQREREREREIPTSTLENGSIIRNKFCSSNVS